MSKVLTDRIAAKLNCTKQHAEEVYKAVINSIEEEITENGRLSIINFGSFTVKHLKRTSTLNKKAYKVDKNIVSFKAGARLSDNINT